MKGVKTYIYGLYKDNKLIYIGKATCPYRRFSDHKRTLEVDYCKIIDIYYDKENYWIKKFLLEGAELKNKITTPHTEDWEIGDIVFFKN